MHLYSIFTLLASTFITLSIALDPTRLVYQFPKGTWLENLVVRPSGSLLITEFTSPNLYSIDPFAAHPEPQLIHHFSSNLALSGITETTPDTYYLIGLNNTPTTEPVRGSNTIYRVHFPPTPSPSSSNSTPEISVSAIVPDALFLNGLLTLNPTTLLASDCFSGTVYAIDIATGSSRIVIKDPLMAPTTAYPLGVNGIRLFHHDILYFTNTAQDILARVRIHPDGTAVGPAVKIASAFPGSSYDDFTLDAFGDAFLATQSGDEIVEVRRDGSQVVVAGRVNTTEIAEPTSAQFGRTLADRNVLYVTTAGGLAAPIDGDVVVGGQVVAVDTAARNVSRGVIRRGM